MFHVPLRILAGLAAVACLLMCAAPSAAADDTNGTELSGSLRLDYWSSTRDLDDIRNVFAVHGEVRAVRRLTADQRLEFEARVSREDVGRANHDEFRAINAYWFGHFDRFDISIGQQKIRWGKADGINPTDFFTPIDYTVLLPFEEDRYLSVPTVRADFQINANYTLSAVLEPFFVKSYVPSLGSETYPIVSDEPSGWRRPQYGLRLLHTGSGLDWSVSAFRGFSTLPALSFVGGTPDGSLLFSRYYPKTTGLGVDAAGTAGKWGFRGELAWTKVDREPGRQLVASNLFAVAGVDRSIDNWNVNVQALLRYTPDYGKTLASPTPLHLYAATQNAILHNQQERWMRGMTLRVGSHWRNETLQTEVRAVAFFEPFNYLLRPLATYALSDSRKLTIGAEYYAGPKLTFFGSLERARTVFLEFRQYY